MSLEAENICAKSPRSPAADFLNDCLVEGDAEQLARAKRVRRRALTLSLLSQAAAIAGLILLPFFGKTDRIALANWTPQPIYTAGGGSAHAHQHPPRPTQSRPTKSSWFCSRRSPVRIPTGIAPPANEPTNGSDNSVDGAAGPGPFGSQIPGANPMPGLNDSAPPRPPVEARSKPPRVHTQLNPAMLIHRVEPVYPPLAHQLRRSGRVELRAIIATDGTIQSLQVVGGDPLFYQSALDAVKQWRYRPTILNGQPYEVETYITVIYTLQ